MGVIISYKGGSKAADILEEAVDWTFGPTTVRLWGKNKKDGPLTEFAINEVAKLEQTDTPLRRFKGLKEKGEEKI